MAANVVKVVFTRSDGRSFAFDDSPMGVTSLEGVDGPVTEVFTEKQAIGDGDIVTGKRVAARPITISASNRVIALNKQMRKIASAFFNPLYTFDVAITYQGSTRTAIDCEIKAIAIPTGNVHKRMEIKLTLFSPSGYLDGGGLNGVNIASVTPRLGWPWVSVVGVGHLYSLYNFSKAITIDNDGDGPTYIRAVFVATGKDPVVNPSLIKGSYHVKVLAGINPGDQLEIDTEKRLVKINGVNVLHLVEKTSNWTGMRMDVGQNSFGFDADEHDNQLAVRIYYTKRFYGIGG